MSLPVIEPDPYGERMRLDRCHVGRPLVPVSDDVAAAGLAAPECALLENVAKRDGFSVEHGTHETIICYRGYRIGGVDRTQGHWFVSDSLGTYVVDRFLRQLGFQKQARAFGSSRTSGMSSIT